MKSKVLYKTLLFLGVGLSFAIPLHPDIRNTVKNIFFSDHREILSIAQGDFIGSISHIVKVRTHQGLVIEVYGKNSIQQMALVDRIILKDHKDGYFNFNGEAANLVINDINGDNTMEILVPSFDKNLVAQLNVYRFNSNIQKLERFDLVSKN